ncbi:hypothetical protein Hanom_Chr10g00961301 [Helianthus anomalus]
MPQEIEPKAAMDMVTTLNPASIADRSETTRRGTTLEEMHVFDVRHTRFVLIAASVIVDVSDQILGLICAKLLNWIWRMNELRR